MSDKSINWTPELLAAVRNTNATVFGALPGKVRAAMKAAHNIGARVEYHNGDAWFSGPPSWLKTCVFRVSPSWTPPAPEPKRRAVREWKVAPDGDVLTWAGGFSVLAWPTRLNFAGFRYGSEIFHALRYEPETTADGRTAYRLAVPDAVLVWEGER